MNADILNLGRAQYQYATGLSDAKRDEDGYICLTPTPSHVDKKVSTLTSSIDDLESKLKKFKAEKAKAEKYQKSDEYKEAKKKIKGKKAKKEKQTLLSMVFNSADHDAEDVPDEEDEDAYRDNKKSRGRKKAGTTLETTYGKRFTPVVSMLHDTISEFDQIATDIQAELSSPQLRAKNMYRSTQIGNLISAKNSKLSAVRELASVATTISNLEYKKEKDKKSEEGSDTSRAISSLGAKFLRGGLDDYSDKKAKKQKDKDKLRKKYKDDSDDDDDDDDRITKAKKASPDSDRELAAEFANALVKHKDDIHFTDAERAIKMEGKYIFKVLVDPTDPEHTWKFVACDPKTDKIIPGFKEKYKGLVPKRKDCRMVFDISKMKCTDKDSARTYKLLFDN